MKDINRDLTKYEIAAIIGYWRNGMTPEEIMLASDISAFDAERIVFNYNKFNTNNQKTNEQ